MRSDQLLCFDETAADKDCHLNEENTVEVLAEICLSVSLFLAGCVLVQFGQEKRRKRKKPADTRQPSQDTPEKKATEEYDEVRSPFGIQRVPRRAGGSPFQQPTVPAPLHRLHNPRSRCSRASDLLKQLHRSGAEPAGCGGSAGRSSNSSSPSRCSSPRLILARASGLSA